MMNSVLVDREFMSNVFNFHPELLSNFPKNQTFGEMFQNPEIIDLENLSFEQNESNNSSEEPDHHHHHNITFSSVSSNLSPEAPDFPDDCLKFISDILLEEGLDENPASAQEYIALQVTEKSLYDALGEAYPFQHYNPLLSDSSDSIPEIDSHHATNSSSFELSFDHQKVKLDPLSAQELSVSLESKQQSSSSSCDDSKDGLLSYELEKPVKGLKKKSRQRDDKVDQKERTKKIQATTNEDYEEMEQYDDVFLLCSEYEGIKFPSASVKDGQSSKTKKTTRSKKQNIQVNQVDLRTLLTQCAQAVSNFDLKTANDLLKQIRLHASPYGDSIQRLAHHVANGLEARIAGTGSTMSTDIVDVKISSRDMLQAYRLYVSAIPFKRMTYFVANSAIKKLSQNAKKIHIIDFGIFLGLQWPCFIKRLSKRPGGPPELRITGIDFPQQGFRPAERVTATGRRLSGYCERFGVPFKYQGIAEKWENIQPEDIKIESDELVIVNSVYRSGTLLDETVDVNSPRDAFLTLVRKLNPALFIHGIVNGTFNAPFFLTRFREALFFYSSVFEVFEATLPREAHERQLIESEVYAKEVYNLVACEGVERVHRPESYKQWQVRQKRAGLKQVALDREHLSSAKAMVKANYHNDFLVDEDKHWMLQGWRGRIFCALSFWQPS